MESIYMLIDEEDKKKIQDFAKKNKMTLKDVFVQGAKLLIDIKTKNNG
jgi:hypothetical protein